MSNLLQSPVGLLFAISFVILNVLQHALAKEPTDSAIVVLIGDLIDDKGQALPTPPALLKQFEYISRETGLKISIQRFPWRRALQNAENGDGLIFGISKTSMRQRKYHFSQGLYASYGFLVTRSDMKFILSTTNDLQGKTLGIPAGTEFGDEFDRLRDKVFKVEMDSGSPMSRFHKLLRRRMDATLISTRNSDPTVLEEKINRLWQQNRSDDPQVSELKFSVLSKPLLIEQIHFAIRADKDNGVINKINEAISKGRQQGEFDPLPTMNSAVIR